MKALKTIIATLLFCSIFFVPNDDAPLSDTFKWFGYECCALYALYRIFKSDEVKEA